MKIAAIQKMVSAIESAGIERYQIIADNHDILLDVGSESVKAIWDDDNEVLWFFRASNNSQPKDNRPISLGCLAYEYIDIIVVPTDYTNVVELAGQAGLSLTEEVTTWLKSVCSEAGLYPVQSYPSKDPKTGKAINYTGIPSCSLN